MPPNLSCINLKLYKEFSFNIFCFLSINYFDDDCPSRHFLSPSHSLTLLKQVPHASPAATKESCPTPFLLHAPPLFFFPGACRNDRLTNFLLVFVCVVSSFSSHEVTGGGKPAVGDK